MNAPVAAFERVSLSPPLGLRNVDALHEQLLAALQQGRPVVIEIDETAEADLSVIQLIEAARLHGLAVETPVSLAVAVNAQMTETLRRAGFLSGMDDTSHQFWFHRKDHQ